MGEAALDALAHLAKRLERSPEFMAYALAAYRSQEGLSDEGLAERLGVLPALVVRLALCKRPASNSLDFGERVRRLADATLVDEPQLLNVLRQVEVLEAFPSTAGTEKRSDNPLEGLLAAARDRVQAQNDESSPDEDRKGKD